MSAVFALHRQEGQREAGKVRNGVAVFPRLICQAVAEHVEGVDAVPVRERGDVLLPFQDGAADSRQKNDSRARASRPPETGADVLTSAYRSSKGLKAVSQGP